MLLQLAAIFNQALIELLANRIAEAAEFVDLALKKFFFYRTVINTATYAHGTPVELQFCDHSPQLSSKTAKRPRYVAKDPTLALCIAAIEIIADSHALASPIKQRSHSIIHSVLHLRTVLWLVTKEAKLAAKLLSALLGLAWAAPVPEVDTRRVVAHLSRFLLAVAKCA